MTNTSIVIVAGWRDSGPGHWQSLWAERLPNARRVVQDDWISPTWLAWVGQLEKTVLPAPNPVVIVAHSLGCIATTHMGCEAAARVCGALLVAPADPERRAILSDFAPVPYAALPYRSIVVASSNDPFCPIRLAGAYARAWGSEFVHMQNAGHINIDSVTASGHWAGRCCSRCKAIWPVVWRIPPSPCRCLPQRHSRPPGWSAHKIIAASACCISARGYFGLIY